MIRLHPHSIRRFSYRQVRDPHQDLRERAFMFRIEMLHQHEPPARIERQLTQEPRKGFQPAGGCADPDDGDRGDISDSTRWSLESPSFSPPTPLRKLRDRICLRLV